MGEQERLSRRGLLEGRVAAQLRCSAYDLAPGAQAPAVMARRFGGWVARGEALAARPCRS